MAKRKKHEISLVSVRVRCDGQEADLEIKPENIRFSGSNQECELCGSHGDVSVAFTCPVCKETHSMELESW